MIGLSEMAFQHLLVLSHASPLEAKTGTPLA